MIPAARSPDWNSDGGTEPIAVVGMGCRLPGGIQSPAGFWEFLVNGKDGITEVPSSRWNREAYYSKDRAQAGKVISREGGFIEGIDLFEPGFFGISESEAPYIDPQHRVLLEVTWEAFERAGLVMERYRGSPVGVFIGCFTADYLHIQFADSYEVGAYTATGAMSTMVAARISHTFDFRGPSMTLDTACSSSLHCVHLACESLRAGDSDVAVAGGSQLTLIPDFNIAEAKAGFLSDTAQCRTFDAGARGYVRSEGIGVAVLKRLRDALAAGDPVQAVILGSAMNQDGRTPSIAQPSLAAQKEVMRRACARAGIPPSAVRYVEAHGTGTSAGDRAEAEAIGTVFRVEPGCSSELLVGSVKSNIGHAEAAAGICGLMKAVLCVKHQSIPRNLHFETPNSAINFKQLGIRVPVTLVPLPDGPIHACVNSFGFGGSNAAVVIRGPLDLERVRHAAPEPPHHAFLLPVSARSASALRESACRMEAWLRNSPNEVRMEDLCYTAGGRRTHHEHRRAFVFSDLDSLRHQLGLLTGGSYGDLPASADSGKGTVWVFSGAGNQRFQTGLQLFREEAVFRKVLKQCDEIYHGLAGFSLIEVMGSRPSGEYIQEAWLSHPVTVSIQLGLASLFRSWGLEPAAIVGHSLGETAAFHAAGVYSLEQTLQLVFHRCECLKPLHGTGGLLAVAAEEASIRAALGAASADFAVAAANGPAAFTLSACGPLLESARERLNSAGIRCQVLAESFACHHRYPALESAAQALEERVRGLEARVPHTPLYSTVTGGALNAPPASSYWATHLLESVKLHPVISLLAEQGLERFLELGAYPALSASIAATVDNQRARICASLHPDRDERSSLLNSLGGLYESGERIDWQALYPSGKVLGLPAYSWQRRRFWREPEASLRHRTRPAAWHLLGERSAGGGTVWRAEISVEKLPFLLDHRIAGEALFPAAGYIDMALCAGQEHFAGYPFVIEDLKLLKPIHLNRGSAFFTEFQLDAANGTFSIYATPSLTDRSHRRVAGGKLRSLPPGVNVPLDPPLLDKGDSDFPGDQLYESFAQRRYDYRRTFRGIRHAWVDHEQAFCEIEISPAAETLGYTFHPAALDVAFQAMLCIRVAREQHDSASSRVLEVPDRIGSIRLLGTPTRRMFVWARVLDTATGSCGELRIFDDSRRLVAHIGEFSTRRVEGMENSGGADWVRRSLYQTVWRLDEPGVVAIPSATNRSEKGAAWVILSDGDAGDRFAGRFAEMSAARVMLGSWRPASTGPAIRPNYEEILNLEAAVAGVIHVGNLDSPSPPAGALASSGDTCCASLLSLARTLSRRRDGCKLWVITKGAHQLRPSDSPADPFQAAAWGLARAIGQREIPAIWGGLIDLSRDCVQSEIDEAASSIILPRGEDQLAFRDRDRLILRLRRMDVKDTCAPEIAFRHDGVYIVTGAFGALGGAVARWMVARGARRLILPDHRDEPRRRASLVAELESAGAVIEVVVLDLSDSGQVAAYCERRRKEKAPPIRGIVYCAGHSRDQLAVAADSATFDGVFNSKVAGAWALHQSLRDAPLEHFVLFSSVASVLPNPGMGAYAAANRFLDGLANHRRSLGLPGLSIAWGPWVIGMTERSGVKGYLDRVGFQCFTVPQAIRLLERLWHSEYPDPIALAVDWPRALAQGALPFPILKDLRCELDVGEASTADSSNAGSPAELESCQPPSSVEERLRSIVTRLISPRNQLDMTIPLVEQGLDSLAAAVLSESLYREFGVTFEANAFADGPNLRDLLDRIAKNGNPLASPEFLSEAE